MLLFKSMTIENYRKDVNVAPQLLKYLSIYIFIHRIFNQIYFLFIQVLN